MNRLGFGKLVVRLRKEIHINNQELLAKKIAISRSTLAKIEGGKRGKIDSDTVLALANGLKLTGLERKEFFVAASLISNNRIAETGNFSQYYEEILETLGQILLPSFVINPYADLLAANRAFFRFFDMDQNILASTSPSLIKHSLIRVFFLSNMKERMGENEFEIFLNKFIYSYKAISLRYRADKEFIDKFNAILKIYPEFEEAWTRVVGTTFKQKFDNVSFSYATNLNKKISIVTTSITSITPQGELILYSFAPTSNEAESYIRKIFKDGGNEVIKFQSLNNK